MPAAQPSAGQSPPPRDYPDLVHFGDGELAPLSLVGGKAKHLMELTALVAQSSSSSFTVPEGCVVTTRVYQRCVEEHLGLVFHAKLGDDALRAARQRIVAARLPDELSGQLASFAGRFAAGTLFAVRSSATVEDAPTFSLAGLAESYLFVSGDELAERVLHCWASLWETRVLQYLAGSYYGTAAQQLPPPRMAVVVQRMIDADVSGVLFTIHPQQGTDDVMSLECVYGAGEGLVGGVCDPYAYSVAWRGDGVTRENSKSKQRTKMVRRSDGRSGLHVVDTSASEQAGEPLQREQIMQVVGVGVAIASHYGVPQDVEFCYRRDGGFFVVQTRPVTRFQCSGVDGYWFSGFAYKSWLAMSMSSVSGYVRASAYGAAKPVPVDDEARLVRPIYGVAYVNYQLHKQAGDEYKTPDYLAAVDGSYALAQRAIAHLRAVEPQLWWLLADGAMAQLADGHFNELLLATSRERLELGFLSFYCGKVCSNAERAVEALLDRLRQDRAVAADVRDAMWNVRPQSSLQVKELQALATALRTEPHYANARRIVADTAASPAAILAALDGDPFLPQLHAYIRRYFFMCERDEDILETRWIDDPSALIMLLQLQLHGDSSSSSSSSSVSVQPPRLIRWLEKDNNKGQRDNDDDDDDVFWPQMPELLRQVRRLRNFLYWKDEVHECYLRSNFFYCKILQEFGRRLQLADCNDVFFADHGSIAAYVQGSLGRAALLAVIEQHRTVRAMYRNFRRPRYVLRHQPKFDDSEASSDEQASSDSTGDAVSATLSGVAGSGGVWTGVAKVCRTLKDAACLQKGDVLVTEMTSPSWTPLFNVVGAVVVEHGGRLSHACVVAREVGIPCVMSVDRCTDVVRTGQRLRVDGTTGTVAILRDTPPSPSTSTSTSTPAASSSTIAGDDRQDDEEEASVEVQLVDGRAALRSSRN